MAVSGSFKLLGLAEMIATFRALKAEAQQGMCRAATNAAAQVVKAAAIENAPVAPEPYEIEGITAQPGNIGRNVIVKRIPPDETHFTSQHIVTVRGKERAAFASRLGSIAEYGSETEFGTVKQPARPWFRPAFDLNKEAAYQAMQDTLRRRLELAAKRNARTVAK